jgi:adenine-specific DNA-methyltransferase
MPPPKPQDLTMTDKRRALSALTKPELIELARAFDLPVTARTPVEEIRDEIARSKRATLDKLLPTLSFDSVARIASLLGITVSGASKESLIAEIGGDVTGSTAAPPASSRAHDVDVTRSRVIPSPPRLDNALTLDVEPRKPRLAWQGMDRREVAVDVPTQIVEIVRPGRATDRNDPLLNTDVRAAGARDVDALPPNRLIWTNDNLVALQTLLDERDPVTRAHRYRGKVDLIYIDPPFMVNSDFQADNTIDIDIDEEEHVQAKKEPSLVEILAYKDTWRQGLDSFLSMLRTRLVLLKDLLAPTGSIYVHLDWHAVHYVKVLMDEVLGYENFQTEIVWKRTSARSGTAGINHIHDAILCYGVTDRPYSASVFTDYEGEYIRDYYTQTDERGRYQGVSLTAPGIRHGETGLLWRGFDPNKLGRHWAVPPVQLDRLDVDKRILWPAKGGQPRLKQYLHEMEGVALQSIWMDIPTINSQAVERLGYPTQKPIALVDRIVRASCPPGGLVLDCFLGSGTTAEAAERLGRRWIGIDNGKYAIHLARKRLIHLHGQPRPPEKPQHDYVECKTCKNIERKDKPQRSPGPFQVRPFSVENMGVYQRAEAWKDYRTQRSVYRDEMIKVFGGEPVAGNDLLHGKKGHAWIHVGPLDSAIAVGQVWRIARAAKATDLTAVTVLSADYDTTAVSDHESIRKDTGVTVTIRAIPASAVDEVRRRIDLLRKNPELPLESMAIPAFYTPLAIHIRPEVAGRKVLLTLSRCDVDVDSFLDSQKPHLKPFTEGMSPAARKKVKADHDKWTDRREALDGWLAKANTWKKFVDFWAVDWEYGSRTGEDGKPIFETDWQSFRTRKTKSDVDDLVLIAETVYRGPGRYSVAAKVTDVFGNDGISVVEVDVK